MTDKLFYKQLQSYLNASLLQCGLGVGEETGEGRVASLRTSNGVVASWLSSSSTPVFISLSSPDMPDN